MTPKHILALCSFITITCYAQGPRISVAEVTRIETTLAANDMQGRRAGTPGIDKAAAFIAAEFKKAGLQPLQGSSFLQSFQMLRPKLMEQKIEIDDVEKNAKSVIVVTAEKELKVNEKSGYRIEHIKAGANFRQSVQNILAVNEAVVVFIDTAFAKDFLRLNNLKRQLMQGAKNMVFVLGAYQPKEFTIKAEHSFEATPFANVVGVLPGKKAKGQYIIFSGHYDHLGIGKPQNGDSIYNGANDDAAGTTAVISLAHYFAKQKNNNRTLVFAAFTAEEIGGFGSQFFSKQLPPDSVVAMLNIEMIGTESKWGKNSAYITGFEKSNLGQLLQTSLKGTAFTFHPDPYPEQDLFYRSDNATLARLGVPAHTISTSKMDSEPNYHKASDEVQTLNMQNMTEIIKAIALSAKALVAGEATPTRVDKTTLR